MTAISTSYKDVNSRNENRTMHLLSGYFICSWSQSQSLNTATLGLALASGHIPWQLKLEAQNAS